MHKVYYTLVGDEKMCGLKTKKTKIRCRGNVAQAIATQFNGNHLRLKATNPGNWSKTIAYFLK